MKELEGSFFFCEKYSVNYCGPATSEKRENEEEK